jgi:hypothetical protein
LDSFRPFCSPLPASAVSSLVPVRGSRANAVSGTCPRRLTLTLGTGTQR